MVQKYKVGDLVVHVPDNRVMAVRRIVFARDHNYPNLPYKIVFNGQYECSWIDNLKEYSDYFFEKDLMHVST